MLLVAASALFVAAPGIIYAGSTEPPAATGQKAVSDDDREFMHEAMMTGNTEVLAGQLAQQKASDPQIKEYAQRMVTEHRMNGEKLKQVARQLGYMLPPQADQMKQNEMLQELSGLSGKEFDEAYAEAQVDLHEDAIDLYEDAAENGTSPQLRQYAKETLPHLEQHLAQAEKLPPLK
jgi:putative membrane protein